MNGQQQIKTFINYTQYWKNALLFITDLSLFYQMFECVLFCQLQKHKMNHVKAHWTNSTGEAAPLLNSASQHRQVGRVEMRTFQPSQSPYTQPPPPFTHLTGGWSQELSQVLMQWQVVVVERAPFLPMTHSGSQESSLDAVEGGDGRFIYLPEIKPQVSRLQSIHTHQGLVLLPRRVPEKVSKVHPTTSYEGPEGEQKSNSTLSLASALDRGECLTPRPGSFTPGDDPVPVL